MNKFLLIFVGALSLGSFSLRAVIVPTVGNDRSTAFMRDGNDSSSEFIISTWKTGEGLPSNEIHDLQETPDGYLWIGTQRGLVRFDGVRFQSFFSSPTGLRHGTHVAPLEVDVHGKLWFAPDQVGIIRRDAEGFTEFLTNETILRNRVVSLSSDGTNGLLWVDSEGRLGRISTDPPHETKLLKRGGATSGASRWMRDFQGKLWLADQRTLKLFEESKWRNVPVPGNATFVAAPRRAGGIWIAREAKLRYVTADGRGREIAGVPWIGQSRVTCLFEDSRERLWVGTLGRGLFCYVSGEFKHVVPTASGIVCLKEDSQKNIWAGTRGSGLVRVSQREFFIHDLSSGLKNEFIRSLSQDNAGRIWMTTVDGGLGWIEKGLWRQLDRADGWRNYDSFCVLPRKDGSVWISTIRRGMWRWLDGQFSKRLVETNALSEPAADMLEDRQGRLWMVTDNTGIFCLAAGKLTGYSTADGLPSAQIRRVIEDDAGDLWAGDWEGGISRFRDNRWELMRKPTGHVDAVRCLIASDDALWIGTSNGGLLRFKNGETARISVEQGMPDACIQQMLFDGKGSLWGGTPHTLFRISVTQLNEVADGRHQSVEAITYGRGDGLPDVSFANWCDPRSWRTADGQLWFATANGAIHFNPENLPESQPPHVLMEQTLMNGKPVTPAELQRLRPQQGRLEFRFTAPCLTAPERVRFRYQLTGVDSDWVDAGATRTATYASIPAGDHVFRVMASSPEGVWGTQTASLALAVHPFFWQTNWFLALVAAAFAGGGVWIIRRTTVRGLSRRVEQLRHQHAMDRERTRIAQDIHDELGANLTSIGLMADMGTRHKFDSFLVAREMRQISETARESVVAMDAIVWALNPRNDSLDHFANYISQFTREFFRPTQLRTRLELPANLPEQPLTTETRHQLFLIVKESFNNIVRHAQATEVCLELACKNGNLHLIVADNGKGLSRETLREGANGLVNLRERIERLGGTMGVKSEKGQGTRIEFILPLAKSKSK